MKDRERERERDRDTETDRQRDAGRHTDRQTDRKREREREIEKKNESESESERERGRGPGDEIWPQCPHAGKEGLGRCSTSDAKPRHGHLLLRYDDHHSKAHTKGQQQVILDWWVALHCEPSHMKDLQLPRQPATTAKHKHHHHLYYL